MIRFTENNKEVAMAKKRTPSKGRKTPRPASERIWGEKVPPGAIKIIPPKKGST